MAGELNSDDYQLPHPQDLERSARESVHIDDPDLAERDPLAFELAVGHKLGILYELEGLVGLDEQTGGEPTDNAD